MTDTAAAMAPERAKGRLDQWLWFARFVKSRSLAAKLCVTGAVTLNGITVSKPNQAVRVGDIVVLVRGGWQHTLRVTALGVRRGPATEARTLYQETDAAARLHGWTPHWDPLLGLDDDHDEPSRADII